LEDRPAPALSGGQQQRVALARALVFSPKVLLLDEPLSNLDAQLREEMRRELKALQQRVNVTVLFVTHDQVEALSLSDRIAIMKFGVLEQVGTPREVYYEPATSFVRDFLGKTFLLPGKVSTLSDQWINVQVDGFNPASLTVKRAKSLFDSLSVGQSVIVATRPEQIELWGSPPDGQCNLVTGYLEAVQFLGDQYEYTVKIGSDRHVLASPRLQHLQTGEKIFLKLKSERITLWPGKT
jgi:ABC-type Fe3+/spermidine/putrescine transport system ATPase subunit